MRCNLKKILLWGKHVQTKPRVVIHIQCRTLCVVLENIDIMRFRYNYQKRIKQIRKWIHFPLRLTVREPKSKHFLYDISLLDKISWEANSRVNGSSDMYGITVKLEHGSQLGSSMKSRSKPGIMFMYYKRLTGHLRLKTHTVKLVLAKAIMLKHQFMIMYSGIIHVQLQNCA